MRFRNLCLCAALVWTCTVTAKPTLRIVTVEEPPASFLTANGKPDGVVVEMVQAIQRQLNDNTPIELMPEGRSVLTAQQHNNVLLFSFSRTAEREALYHWILPVLKKRWQIYLPPNSTRQLNSLADLRKLNAIGVVRGDVRESYLIQLGFTNLIAVTTHQQNLQMLRAGRVEAITADSLELAYQLNQQTDMPPPRLAMTLRSSDVYLMMPKNADPQLVQRWQQAAAELTQNGELEQIAINWQQRIEQDLHLRVGRSGHMLQF